MSDRYARQMILPEVGPRGQARLAAARVLVVGAGGLGSTVIPALAGAGIGRLRLMDADVVSESNLHRQTLYGIGDLGHPKVTCAAARIATLNPDCTVEPICERFDPCAAEAALRGVDVVVDAADSFAATYALSDLCHARGLPLVSASVLGLSGYVGGFCGTGPSYRALFPELPAQAASCDTAGVLGPVVACLGALQAQMVLSVLLGLKPSPLGQLLTADLGTFELRGFRFDAAPEPRSVIPFVGLGALRPEDCVIDLRGPQEAPVPVTPEALRLPPADVSAWQPPRGRRVVLCCRSGVRAWQAARDLRDRNCVDVAVLAVGPVGPVGAVRG